ncbi:hypothetical protein [Agromyces laixinhei]|nr:hypothetical protein [Agromyces laixinhei]
MCDMQRRGSRVANGTKGAGARGGALEHPMGAARPTAHGVRPVHPIA